ncbi:hypothetical protein Murru_2211 [Allomuricauda ruestringensis DSM 13258]|uniref:Uncharacterized protein n=1 Tax=Allomuricauda ruestringensis (strain DSM 13258 / CIP 107369 / LMG 19739 / B1) TaxID=886377 RepID=G2PMT8_ALLRU|nr:hypothetical protein Murru_2211 [Allomuricauda ruestringensis DSM 13258]
MTHLTFFYFEILKVPNTTTKYHDECHFQGLIILSLFIYIKIVTFNKWLATKESMLGRHNKLRMAWHVH